MRTAFKLLAAATVISVGACDVDQTKEGDLPEVEVNASGGQLPEYDVDGPEVNVGTENKTIQVPTVDVDAPNDDDDKNKTN